VDNPSEREEDQEGWLMPIYEDENGVRIESDQELNEAELTQAFSTLAAPQSQATNKPLLDMASPSNAGPSLSPTGQPRSIAEREAEARREFDQRDYLKRQKEHFAKTPEAIGIALKQAPSVIAEGALGFIKMIEKNPILSPAGAVRHYGRQLTGQDEVWNPMDYGIDALREYTKSLEPHYEAGTPEYYAHAAILSLSQNIIPIAVGTVTGGQALPLFMMGAQSAGSKYNDLLEQGMSHDKASVVAGMWGAAEVIGEKLSIGKLTKGPALSRIILGTLYDIPGELLTEVLQAGIDKGILHEEDAFNWQRFIDTAVITGLSGPFLGAGSSVVSRIQKRATRRNLTAAIDGTPEQGGVPLAGEQPGEVGGTATAVIPTSPVIQPATDGRAVALQEQAEVGSFDGDTLTISDTFTGDRAALARQLLSESVSEEGATVIPPEQGATVETNAEAFVGARKKAKRQQFLTHYTPDEMTGFMIRMVPGKDAGYAIKPDGDLINVFNATGEKKTGIGDLLIRDAIKNGAKKLDCYNGFLVDFYTRHGFVEVGRDKWNEEYRPEGWLDSDKTPDIIYMEYRGESNDSRTDAGTASSERNTGSVAGTVEGSGGLVGKVGERVRGAVDNGEPGTTASGTRFDSLDSQSLTEQIKAINDEIGEKGSIDLTPVVELGRSVYESGARTYEQFSTRIKELVGNAWEKVKEFVQQAWDVISSERGSIDFTKKDGKIGDASQQTTGETGLESPGPVQSQSETELSVAYNQAEAQATAELKQSQTFEEFERVIFGNVDFGDTFNEDPLARHLSKEDLRAFREKGLLGAKIEELKTSLSILKDEVSQARSLANDYFRAGRKIGALDQLERAHQIEAMRKQRQAAVREGSKLRNWLKSAEKKYPKLTTIDPEYRAAIQNAIDLNADAVENFVLTQLQNGDVFMLDEGQLDLLREADIDSPTLEDLRNRVSVVKQLLYQGRKQRQIQVANERYERKALINEINGEIRSTWGVPETSLHEDLAKDLASTPMNREKEKKTLSDRMGSPDSWLRKGEYILERLGGYRWKDSLIYNATFQKTVEAERTEIKLSLETGKMVKEAFGLLKEEFQSGVLNSETAIAGGKPISRWNMIAIALNSGNEGNRKALVEGSEGNLTDERIDLVVNALTPNEKAFVRALWNILEWQRPYLQKAYKSMTGEDMKLVEGQYYPLMFDKRYATRIAEAQEEQNLFRLYGSVSSVQRGFTKARTGGTMAVDLDFSRIVQHIDDVNHFIAYGETVRDVNRIISNIKVKQAVENAIGEPYNKALKQWLKHIANPQHETRPGWDRAFGVLKNNAATTILGLSLSTAFCQPFAITQTANRLGPVSTLTGFLDFYRDYAVQSQFIYENSPFMAIRTSNFDVTVSELKQQADRDKLFGEGRAGEKMRDAYFSLIGFTDKLITMPTWNAAYQKEMKKSGDMARAIDFADMIVRQTQSSGMPKDLAEVQRGSNIRKSFVMFYSYFSSTYNEMARSVDLVKLKQVGYLDLMKSFFWIMAVPAICQSIIKNRAWLGDDDEPEDIPGDVAKELVGYGLGTIPIVGNALGAIMEGFDTRPSPLLNIGKEALILRKTIPKVVTGDTSYNGKGVHPAIRSGAMLAGYAFGLPSRQIMRTADEAWDAYNNDEVTWQNVYGLIYKERKKK
jgi:hypothetical protein